MTSIPGLHRTDPVHNLSTVYRTVRGAFEDRGSVRLGAARRMVVIAVDGLGYDHSAAHLRPDTLTALTSEFPTTTMACMLTAMTGVHAAEHGFVGVQYLHADGRRTVNCHNGHLDEPTSDAPPRPTVTPELPTVFTALAAAGIPTRAFPNELTGVHDDIRSRLFRDCAALGSPLPPSEDPRRMVALLTEQLSKESGFTWAYLDFDTHIHGSGVDRAIVDACADLDRLARSLADAGTTVVLFSDHGLTANRAAPEVDEAWRVASSPRWCRLPGGGAGRVRWLYPHQDRREELLAYLGDRIGDAVVTTPEALAEMGWLAPGSIGAQRLGEIVLIAVGPDFPIPDPSVRYEHGSMTDEEIRVPLAIWNAHH